MSAYKKLNSQDVFITDYQAQKNWTASGSLVTAYNIDTFRGLSSSINISSYPTDYYKSQSQDLVFSSIKHNYYEGSLLNGTFTGSRDLSLQTTLAYSSSRKLRNEVGVVSIPKAVFGTHIVPNSFVIQPDYLGTENYIEDGYAMSAIFENLYIETPEYAYGGNPLDDEDYLISESFYVTESVIGSPGQYIDIDQNQQSTIIIDDGDGNLFFSGSELSYTKPKRFIGDIIYNQGMVIFTDEDVARYYSTYLNPDLQWKSNQPIYTYNVHCKVKDSEMGFTFNPSAITGSNGVISNNVTGSDFSPYFTSVGLYNDANELIAVAKTNRAIPKPKNTDLTVVIKIDI